MNSDEIWLLQLWSGTLGSFIAAIVGGLVALGVVRLTDRQQRKIAAEAREIAAISEFLAQMQVLAMTFQKPDEFAPREQMAAMFSTVVKLHMAGPSVKELADALTGWPGKLIHICVQDIRDKSIGREPITTDVYGLVSSAGGTLFHELRDWHLESKKIRLQRIKAIEEFGLKVSTAYEKVAAHQATMEAEESQPKPATEAVEQA